MPFSKLPIVTDLYPLRHHDVDGIIEKVHIMGGTFAVTFFKLMVLPGATEPVRVPWVELRLPLATWIPNYVSSLLIEERKRLERERPLLIGEIPLH